MDDPAEGGRMIVSVGSVDALPYLGPRPRALAAGDLMVDRSFRWSDCGRSVFRGPPRGAWVPRSLLELAACFERIGDGGLGRSAWREGRVVRARRGRAPGGGGRSGGGGCG